MGIRRTLNNIINSIGTKIIFPYVLLTIIVAGVGAFIVTNLVTGTLQERFDNQLIDSGRVVAEVMVDYEQARLAVLRAVTGTQGVPEGLKRKDIESLDALVPQIIANSNTDAVVLVDNNGTEIFIDHPHQQPGIRNIALRLACKLELKACAAFHFFIFQSFGAEILDESVAATHILI